MHVMYTYLMYVVISTVEIVCIRLCVCVCVVECVRGYGGRCARLTAETNRDISCCII